MYIFDLYFFNGFNSVTIDCFSILCELVHQLEYNEKQMLQIRCYLVFWRYRPNRAQSASFEVLIGPSQTAAYTKHADLNLATKQNFRISQNLCSENYVRYL